MRSWLVDLAKSNNQNMAHRKKPWVAQKARPQQVKGAIVLN